MLINQLFIICLIEFDYKIISPVLSEKSAIIFTVSDKTVVPYSALLSEIYLIESGAAATVALTVTQVSTDSFKDPNTLTWISFCFTDR